MTRKQRSRRPFCGVGFGLGTFALIATACTGPNPFFVHATEGDQDGSISEAALAPRPIDAGAADASAISRDEGPFRSAVDALSDLAVDRISVDGPFDNADMRLAINPDGPADAAPDVSAGAYRNGLIGIYYKGTNFETAAFSRIDSTINFLWLNDPPAENISDDIISYDNFSVRWQGKIEANFSETYTFFTNTDDGVRLWVNGQLIIDRWVARSQTEDVGTIALKAGQKVDLKMEYFEGTFTAIAQLSWSSASQPRQIVPADRLFSAITSE